MVKPKSSGCMAEHMAPAREMLDCEDLGKSSESVTVLTKARGRQMSPLKSQMAFGLFYSALFDKTPPKSTKKLTLCTGDHSLPASFLPPPISFSTDRMCTQAETVKTGQLPSVYLISASTNHCNHCKNSHSYIYPQQRRLHHGPASTQTSTLPRSSNGALHKFQNL